MIGSLLRQETADVEAQGAVSGGRRHVCGRSNGDFMQGHVARPTLSWRCKDIHKATGQTDEQEQVLIRCYQKMQKIIA